MASIRQEKISNLLKRELALIFQQESRNFFGGKFITVTHVNVTSDLGLAKTYLSILASQDEKEDLKFIEQQNWRVRKKLASRVGKQLRKIPELKFFIDDSLERYAEVERILNE